MVQSPEEKGSVMPYIFVRDYDIDMMQLNKDVYHIFVESVIQTGGERKVVYLRQHERGLPMTLRNNYADIGLFTAETEARDVRNIETELQNISRLSYNGANVCVPILPLSREMDSIQRLSPKLAGYLKKRMDSIGMSL